MEEHFISFFKFLTTLLCLTSSCAKAQFFPYPGFQQPNYLSGTGNSNPFQQFPAQGNVFGQNLPQGGNGGFFNNPYFGGNNFPQQNPFQNFGNNQFPNKGPSNFNSNESPSGPNGFPNPGNNGGQFPSEGSEGKGDHLTVPVQPKQKGQGQGQIPQSNGNFPNNPGQGPVGQQYPPSTGLGNNPSSNPTFNGNGQNSYPNQFGQNNGYNNGGQNQFNTNPYGQQFGNSNPSQSNVPNKVSNYDNGQGQQLGENGNSGNRPAPPKKQNQYNPTAPALDVRHDSGELETQVPDLPKKHLKPTGSSHSKSSKKEKQGTPAWTYYDEINTEHNSDAELIGLVKQDA